VGFATTAVRDGDLRLGIADVGACVGFGFRSGVSHCDG
jgi:hypothetical protein